MITYRMGTDSRYPNQEPNWPSIEKAAEYGFRFLELDDRCVFTHLEMEPEDETDEDKPGAYYDTEPNSIVLPRLKMFRDQDQQDFSLFRALSHLQMRACGLWKQRTWHSSFEDESDPVLRQIFPAFTHRLRRFSDSVPDGVTLDEWNGSKPRRYLSEYASSKLFLIPADAVVDELDRIMLKQNLAKDFRSLPWIKHMDKTAQKMMRAYRK